jgi:hypothetical protein
MTVADQMARFADRYGKQLIVDEVPWRYSGYSVRSQCGTRLARLCA